ncbi:ATP phosphoribosyltransferase [Aequorivita antarctica]|uniref:ATP phosphoribosyltransferase n=1 Tax=Aequorivita antarctica TaxID=153266 RepID=A0A5C6Z342_9FLAO|nr:ATP phosphoribosyltransferase [Aequorivita antarctica]TXD74469.1 ATP phosphoribosyltransferase [Aequorivita antarctica]SRX73828.1 ATP phosphoribosyltransferase [Aequorivita antarctica]
MKKLKIAVQKSGRLHDESLALLKDCGIYIDNGRDQLKAVSTNFPLEIYYLRNGDIPQYLKDGVVDCAIIGENLLVEKGDGINVVGRLGFSKCRVSLAVSKTFKYKTIADLNGKRIATSYPETTRNYLKQNGVEAELHIINGSVEIAPNIGLADAICDIVSSGSTLFKNNLKEVEVIMKSEAVLAVSPTISENNNKILDKLRFRIESVLQGRDSRYVLLNAPNDKIDAIIKILPGMKSPTLLPLAKDGWSSLHSVVNRDVFWEVIEELKEAGAEGILVCPIEKMIF